MCCLTSWHFLQITVCFFVLNCSWQFFYKQCKHICKHCDHCDHWRQQNQPESKTREKVTLDSLDSFRRWVFFPPRCICLWSSDIFSFSLCVSFCHQHNGNLCSATLKTSLFSLGGSSTIPPLATCASLLLIFLPREAGKPSPHLLTLPPSANAQKDSSLHACTPELNEFYRKCKNNDGSNQLRIDEANTYQCVWKVCPDLPRSREQQDRGKAGAQWRRRGRSKTTSAGCCTLLIRYQFTSPSYTAFLS